MNIFLRTSLCFLLGAGFGSVCSGDHVVETVKDQVGEGNYTYYTLGLPGRIALVLTTEQGDADLYVSSEIKHPSFYLEEHSLSSATCGEDRLDISEFMDRPIHIAVYGHPRALITQFKLDVVVVDMKKETDFFRERAVYEEEEDTEGGGEDPDPANTETAIQVIWPILKGVLEILIDVIL